MLTGAQRLARSIPMLLACGGLMVASLKKHYPVELGVKTNVVEVSETNTTAELKTVATTPQPFHVQIRPLADLISKGEGDWNAVNRGRAGDSPGGLLRWFGRDAESFTLQEILNLQAAGRIYAVGRYQFIPSTMRYAVRQSGLPMGARFNAETQDRLLATLIESKRPRVGQYIRGNYNNLQVVLDDLAKEWASIEFRGGRTYYGGIGGNAAHISRAETSAVIRSVRFDYK